ncbi:efflux RND transporter periplasmic adaptor subunit [Sphingobium sp. BYY-5]|uniref:efflux RND transporter periplasmic adaptor subunit n=1 Tax=Sphingobium sp. BYY-5 TaxID=2926400 RepID=UPI001FA7C43F|nr:efflux RND transporter periplasmic adaptor subunit [Sphingobium sp. BYY-5]MCI4591711.1 efflux RND transporter periplasmic adaptor subunit [Sphingobium sp. BYY-5]
MKSFTYAVPLALALSLAACSGGTADNATPQAHEEDHEEEEGVVTLTDAQIRSAQIELVPVDAAGTKGMLSLPATIEADPQGIQIVTAAIGGRIVALNRNLGETVRGGETLVVVESREAAQIQGDIEAASARLTLARSNLAREQRLFAEKVSPEQDLIAARTAATEAAIALRLARQQLAATGRASGGLNRVALPAPISGQIIGRTALLGQVVAADTEVYRIANLSKLSVSVSLSAADAALIRPGVAVTITGQGRSARATLRFLSPILDAQTRLVPAIVALDNSDASWRIGEAVTAAIDLPVKEGDQSISVPQVAVQTIEGKPSVFVRTRTGFRAMSVETGAVSGERILITRGLKGGERIAATGSFILKAELGKGEAEHGH